MVGVLLVGAAVSNRRLTACVLSPLSGVSCGLSGGVVGVALESMDSALVFNCSASALLALVSEFHKSVELY